MRLYRNMSADLTLRIRRANEGLLLQAPESSSRLV